MKLFRSDLPSDSAPTRRNMLALLWAMAAGPVAARSDSTASQDVLSNPGLVAFFNNEFEQAIAYFSQQITLHPDDPDQYNYLAQSVLYSEMYRNGSLESQLVSGNNPFLRREKMGISPATRQRFAGALQKSLDLSKSRLQRNPRDVRALQQQSSAHAMRATYYFLVEKSWSDSLKEASAARRAAEAILSIDADFVDAHMILGVYSYVVGSLPFYLRAIGAVGGFHGDKAGGLRQLQLVAEHGDRDKYDAQVALAVLYRRDHNPRLAIPLLQNLASTFPRNALFRFEQIQMFSDMGNKEAALEVLNTIEKLRASGMPGYKQLPPEKIRFVAGNLHFWYNDLPQALDDFKVVTQHAADLDLNSALLGWLRLGQIYDLQGKHDQAVVAYTESMKVAPGSEAANEAKGYIGTPYRRKAKRESG